MIKSYLALDRKIALEFHKCAEQTKEYPHDYVEMRKLRIELQELCGITELEVLNVLIYRNVTDYICKYNRGVSMDLLTRKPQLLSHNNTHMITMNWDTKSFS